MENEVKRISFEDFLKYLRGEKIENLETATNIEHDKIMEDSKANMIDNSQQKQKEQENYIPQKGDIVEIIGGEFKGVNIKGEIIEEVEAYNSYLIKISELNAVYILKGDIKVIEKKIDSRKEKEIKLRKLEDELTELRKIREEHIKKVNYFYQKVYDKMDEIKKLREEIQ